MARARLLAVSSSADRVRLSGAGVVLSVLIFAGSVAVGDLGDSLLMLLALPLVFGAVAYGVRGGLVFALLCSALATVWWLDTDPPGGHVWLLTRLLVVVGLGVLLGWFVDSRHALAREVELQADLSLDLIATASSDGYFTRVNPAFTRTLGFTSEELLARPFVEFVHPDDVAATIGAVATQTDAGHEVVNFQNRYRTKDGEYRWLEWTSRPLPGGRTLVAVARDITDRKLLERYEHRYQERLEQDVAARTRALEAAHKETLQRLALAAEFRDDETHAHNERVSRTAGQLADALALPAARVKLIADAALLHDVGKVGVSDTVLFKPGPLDADEHEHVRGHAEIGSSILAGSQSEVLRTAEEIARCHHEWWDGSGYPAGLAGAAIPLSARIVAVADVFDALTRARPYKEAWPLEDAISEIVALAGRQFDPQVVRAFQRLGPSALMLPTDLTGGDPASTTAGATRTETVRKQGAAGPGSRWTRARPSTRPDAARARQDQRPYRECRPG